ncbi:MAG: PDZ domain-containing protein [Pyrinomonadaceae bacterium]
MNIHPGNGKTAQITLLFLISALLTLSARSQTTRQIGLSIDIRDRSLDVKIEVPANDLDKTAFSLSDWAGQDNYAENIYRVSAREKAGGRALTTGKTGARTWTIENAKKAFELSYTVVSQKNSFMGDNVRNHFHPTLFRDYVFLWGAAFLFFPDQKETADLPVKLRIAPNEYGRVYANFGDRADSFNDLNDLLIAAGDYQPVEKKIGGRDVTFLIQGKNWKFTGQEFAETVAGIIAAQVRYMGFSPSNDKLLITLNEGTPFSKGGTVVKNVISVYPNPQSELKDFDNLKLIAHENFHFWNGNYWHSDGKKPEGYYKWMSEGFTEYYSGLTLYREGLIDEREFVGWLNQLLLEYQTNPVALTATAEVLGENYWKSRDYNRLPYVKGALIALLIDIIVRQKTSEKKQIDDLMKLMIEKTDSQTGYNDELLLNNLNQLTGTGNRRFYDDFIIGAKFLPITETLKSSGITAAETPRQVFELGFSIEGGRFERGVRVKEVISGSNAEKAGLKPGDQLNGFSIGFGNPEEEAKFNVQRGEEKLDIKFFPRKTADILQIDPNAKFPK